MQRRSFLKSMASAAMAVMLPLQLTRFGLQSDLDAELLEALDVQSRPSVLRVESLEAALKSIFKPRVYPGDSRPMIMVPGVDSDLLMLYKDPEPSNTENAEDAQVFWKDYD